MFDDWEIEYSAEAGNFQAEIRSGVRVERLGLKTLARR